MRTCFAVLAAVAAFLCAAVFYALCRMPVFAGGGYELYTGTSSGEIVCTDTPFWDKLFLPVTGESARFEGDVHEELLRSLRAEVVFCERTGGVVSYYCRSPLLGSGVLLGGERVNLHIAVGGGRTAAGTPVIFGGF